MVRTPLGIDVRSRVLERIRKALAEGDEAAAMRIALELTRRFDAARGARRDETRQALR